MESTEKHRKRRMLPEEPGKKTLWTAQTINIFNCTKCLIRLRITNSFKCKCLRIFCGKHRYSDEHNCTYDYKLENIKKLEKENPKILSTRAFDA
ncbi:hypothetical protein NEOKW01_1506 [Nematocida sp. AWRm80]|nr:hypothetical protein NEOKW01_1506 [Nematocida sp. AWRm80]